MNTRSETRRSLAAPQLKVRSSLRAGQTSTRGPSSESLDQCISNVEYWQQLFRDQYARSITNGRRPPFNNPL